MVYIQYPIMTKHKFRNALKRKITHWHKTFRPFTQYLFEAPLGAITALSLLGFDVTSFAHMDLRIFSFADPLKLCQVGWGPSVDSDFQVSPEMFDWVQVRAPLLHCLVCLGSLSYWMVNFWPSLKSSLDQGFHYGSLCTVLCSAFPQPWAILPLPAAKKHPHNMMLPWCLELRSNCSVLVLSGQRILFLTVF